MTKAIPDMSKTLTKPTGVNKTKAALVLLRRKKGATIAQLCKASGWKPHSVLALASATFRKRMQLDMRCEQLASGQSRYRIALGGGE